MVTAVESVAVVGAGEMGTPIAGHLDDAGYDVYAYDVAPEARALVAERGATLADSPGEAAAATDLTLVLVGTADQVEAVLCGDDGVFAHAEAGHVVALGSTLPPCDCETYAEVGREEDIAVIDVPSCRGGGAAERGELLVLCGGPEGPIERAWPVLECFAAAGDVVHLGPIGAGQVGKSANNTLLWACLVADYEVLSLARAYGLDVDELRRTLTRSSGDNWVLHEWSWIHTKWAHKDMAITVNMAMEKGISAPLAGLVSQLVQDIDQADLDELR